MRPRQHAASMPCPVRDELESIGASGRPGAYDRISASDSREETMARWIPAAGVAMMVASASAVSAQGLTELRKLYDAGQYQQVVAAPADDPRVVFLVALSHMRLGHRDEARQVYEQLAGRGSDDPWHDVGRSGVAMLASNSGEAVEAASQAV